MDGALDRRVRIPKRNDPNAPAGGGEGKLSLRGINQGV